MDNETRLTLLKRDFYLALLENAVLQRLIVNAMDQATAVDQLPDFTAEPWRPVRDEPVQVLGLMYMRSRSLRTGILSASVAIFEYIEVLLLGTEKTDCTLLSGETAEGRTFHFNASEALLQVENAARNEIAAASAHFINVWQTFMVNAALLGAHVDPMMGTFTTEERSYMIP